MPDAVNERKIYECGGGRDLYFRVKCKCPDPNFIGTSVEHIMKRELYLTGYDDAHFFDSVNATPRYLACNCGRNFHVQWFRDGVEFNWIDE